MFWPNLEKIDSSIVLYYVLYKISPYFESILTYLYVLINQIVFKSFHYQTYDTDEYDNLLEMLLGSNYEKYKYPGTYLIRYNGKYHNMNHNISKVMSASYYTVNLTTISFYSIYNNIKSDLKNYIEKKTGKKEFLYVTQVKPEPKVYSGRLHGCITHIHEIEKRSWKNTVISDANLKLINSCINRFITDKSNYEKYNIPKKLCILFYGRPGMGKTSIIKALAYEYKYNIVFMNLGVLTDEILPFLYNTVQKNTFIVFEDVDCAFQKREESVKIDEGLENKKKNKESTGVTLSGFLNALDGLSSNNGIITILTTNFIDKLDDALIRKGRVDLRIELTPSPDLYGQMYDRFFPEVTHREKFIEHCTKNDFCLADAQDLCVQNLSNIEFLFFFVL